MDDRPPPRTTEDYMRSALDLLEIWNAATHGQPLGNSSFDTSLLTNAVVTRARLRHRSPGSPSASTTSSPRHAVAASRSTRWCAACAPAPRRCARSARRRRLVDNTARGKSDDVMIVLGDPIQMRTVRGAKLVLACLDDARRDMKRGAAANAEYERGRERRLRDVEEFRRKAPGMVDAFAEALADVEKSHQRLQAMYIELARVLDGMVATITECGLTEDDLRAIAARGGR